MDINRILDICKGKDVYIQTHNFPDPDAIGSAYGLQQLLKHYGVETVICHEGQVDKLSARKLTEKCDIEIFSHEEIKDKLKEGDIIILVDSQKNSGNTTDIIGDEAVCIDHHPTFVEVEYQYKDIRKVGACASIIADYYRQLGITPDSNTATAMLYGIKMDTLQFQRGVTPFDIEIFGYLFEHCDHDKLSDLESNNMEFADLQAYGTAIENISVFDYIGFSYIDYPCPDAMIAILSDFILSLVEVEVVIIYAKRANGYKFSVRSERDDIHAGEIANKVLSKYGNGGGHAVMAGGFVPEDRITDLGNYPMDVIRNDFLAEIQG